MERPISLRLCKVYYSMAGRRNLYLPATQTCKDLNILCNNKPAIIAFVDNGFDTFLLVKTKFHFLNNVPCINQQINALE